jgi:hypothetical protein
MRLFPTDLWASAGSERHAGLRADSFVDGQ